MPRISIIVPVYNVEQYISKCLESIISQTYQDWECLLIDDGSKDSSGKICDEYASRDTRFRVFHKENGGVSSARNLGLDNAKGEWVTFCDSDDELICSAFETYTHLMKDDVDFIKAGYIREKRFSKQKKNITCHSQLIIKDKEKMYEKVEAFSYCGFLWNECIKRELIGSHRFYNEISWCEDHIFSYELMSRSKCLCLSPNLTYKYYINDDSSKNGLNLSRKNQKAEMIVSAAYKEKNAKLLLTQNKDHIIAINKRFDDELVYAAYNSLINLNFVDSIKILFETNSIVHSSISFVKAVIKFFFK